MSLDLKTTATEDSTLTFGSGPWMIRSCSIRCVGGRAAASFVNESGVHLVGCKITSKECSYGIECKEKSQVSMEETQVVACSAQTQTECAAVGVLGTAALRAEKSEISNNCVGLVISDDSDVKLLGCKLENNSEGAFQVIKNEDKQSKTRLRIASSKVTGSPWRTKVRPHHFSERKTVWIDSQGFRRVS
mmetsp:Transcript_9153/g.14437  ORF Transcript_9153/g.14437 Transcript_9153/m.14437 type:complete len:189 (-) Transcript_9153:1353-1919(-)